MTQLDAQSKKFKVGIIGAGMISERYIESFGRFPVLELVSIADLVPEHAAARAEAYAIPKVYSVDDLLADPEVDIVVNLTVPRAHAEVSRRVLEAGKHCYSEKPLGTERDAARALLELAARKNLRLGCAPDTLLGAGQQTARRVIDDGWIGRPFAATAFFMSRELENWHPNPFFFFERGGSPLFDMGPYYLSALVNIFGPVKSVVSSASVNIPERPITNPKMPHVGRVITPTTPMHTVGILEFVSGATANVIFSRETWHSDLSSRIEVYGPGGTLAVPDPNMFDGVVRLMRKGSWEWTEVPALYDYKENSRGVGVADMAHAVRGGRPHRCSAELAYHVLDVMVALEETDERRYRDVDSRVTRPPLLPIGLTEGVLDDALEDAKGMADTVPDEVLDA